MQTLALLAVLLAATNVPSIFRIPLKGDGPLRFIVTGDAGTGDAHLHAGVTALAAKTHIDAILLAGDNVYPCGVASVDDPGWRKVTKNFGDAGVPIYPVLGNHDYGDADDGERCPDASPAAEVKATRVVPRWVFPARQYELDSPLATVVMFDSEPIARDFQQPVRGGETARRETAWLASALAGTRGRWRIVVGHHPIYSSGPHDHSSGEKRMRETVLPLLRHANVDLYIAGHDHDAELIGSTTANAPGPLFLIAGNGAHSVPLHHRTSSAEPKTIFPTSFPPQPLVGFTLLEIDRHTLSITFYDSLGRRASETYTLRK